VLGKPAPTFFKLAVEGLRCAVEDVAMIGTTRKPMLAERWPLASWVFSSRLANTVLIKRRISPSGQPWWPKNLEVAVDLLLG